MSVEILRGKLPINQATSATDKRLPLVHTTELSEYGISLTRRFADAVKEITVGPVVLLPRVGRPDHAKVHAYMSSEPIMLSDCVIAIKCVRQEDAELVLSVLRMCWLDVEGAYRGTCALHITLGSVKAILEEFGFLTSIK